MKFKGHIFWTFLYLLIITYFLEPTAIVLIFIVAFIGTMPDIDLKLYKGSHRWIWFHSLFLPILAFIFYPTILTLLILLAFGHHFFLDVIINLLKGKKQTGFYTICVIPSYRFNFILFKIKTREYRMDGLSSTIWLLGNFVGSLIILIYYVLIIFKQSQF